MAQLTNYEDGMPSGPAVELGERWLQTTQSTSGGAVTAVIDCCANCVKTSRPSNRCPIYRFLGKTAMQTRWMVGAAPHKGDVETIPGLTTTHIEFFNICHNQIHSRKQLLLFATTRSVVMSVKVPVVDVAECMNRSQP